MTLEYFLLKNELFIKIVVFLILLFISAYQTFKKEYKKGFLFTLSAVFLIFSFSYDYYSGNSKEDEWKRKLDVLKKKNEKKDKKEEKEVVKFLELVLVFNSKVLIEDFSEDYKITFSFRDKGIEKGVNASNCKVRFDRKEKEVYVFVCSVRVSGFKNDNIHNLLNRTSSLKLRMNLPDSFYWKTRVVDLYIVYNNNYYLALDGEKFIYEYKKSKNFYHFGENVLLENIFKIKELL